MTESVEGARAGNLLDLVYIDPPWEAEAEYAKTLELLGSARGRLMLAPARWLSPSTAASRGLRSGTASWRRLRTLKQGDAALSFYAVADRE